MNLTLLTNNSVGNALPVWKEIRREGPKERYCVKNDEELFKFFGDIPEDLGDDFHYRLMAPIFEVNFLQSYLNSEPLSKNHFLTFFFGEGTVNPGGFDNPFGSIDGFDFLREAKIKFMMGEYCDSNKPYVTLESQNLGMHNYEGHGRDNTFTELGTRFMESLLSFSGIFKTFPGMRDEDKVLFASKIELITQEYRANRIKPRDWMI